MARLFVDENDLALGKALAGNHLGDVLFPGHVDLPDVPRGTIDDEWLPVTGAQKLVVITRDKRIRYRPVEKRMWVVHAVRGFVLTGRKSPVDDRQPSHGRAPLARSSGPDGRAADGSLDVRLGRGSAA